MKKYDGACHCKKVQFEVETDLSDPVHCNCSFCVRRGALLQRVPADDFSLLKGEDSLTRYGERSFSDHFFCNHCGVHVFTRLVRKGEQNVVVNLACLDGLDTSTIEPRIFDGANLL
ncbi:MAG: GFA family protein [Woeseiaceae bacterium]